MVTIQEAQQTAEQRRQQLEAERKRIRETKVRELSKAELLKRTLQEREQRRGAITRLEQAKAKSLAEIQRYEAEQLRPYETQVAVAQKQKATYEKQVAAYQSEQSEWAQARKLIIEGKTLAARGSPSLQSKIRKLRAGLPEPTAPTYGLKSQAEISRITGIPISQLKSPEEIAGIISRPPTIGVTAPAISKVPEYKPPETILGGEPFTLWEVPQYAARIIEKTYPYQKAISYTETRHPIIHKILTTRTPRIVEEVASGVAMWTFFSPVMGTAVFQKLKIKGKFEELAEIDMATKREMGKAVMSKIEKDILRMKTPEEQWKYLAKLAKKAKTEEQISNFKVMMEGLMERNILKPIPVELAPTIVKEMPIMFYQAPTMKGVGIMGEAVSRFPEPKQLFFDVPEEVEPIPKLKERPLQLFAPALAIAPKVTTALKAKQIQVPKLKQPQALAPVPKLKLALKSKLLQKQALRLKQIQKQVPKYKGPFDRPPRSAPKIPIPIPEAKTIRVTKDYKVTKSEVGFEYYVRRAGRWILMGTADTLTEASRKASAIVTATLAAAFKIMRKKEVVKAPFGRMFRPAKKEVGVVVQKRKFRLAAKPEVKEIQWFKKKKEKKVKWL